MENYDLAAICDAVNHRYRDHYGTMAVGMLTSQLLRLLLSELRARGWQAPEDASCQD